MDVTTITNNKKRQLFQVDQSNDDEGLKNGNNEHDNKNNDGNDYKRAVVSTH